jgi:hypothetical protein
MADQGLAGFALRAVEGDFEPWEKSCGEAFPAGLNTAARPSTFGQPVCQAKDQLNSKAGQRWLTPGIRNLASSFVRIIELPRQILR